MRIGHGYDVHRLVSGRALILGGVTIPYEKGLDGHSDADVLVHAVMDALLGAAAMGDIGKLFPDNDNRYLGADSMELLREVSRRLEGAGYRLGNLDATIIAQRPKLAPHIEQMRRNIAGALHTGLGNISVKATTEERLGFTGSGEGIAAHAVWLSEESTGLQRVSFRCSPVFLAVRMLTAAAGSCAAPAAGHSYRITRDGRFSCPARKCGWRSFRRADPAAPRRRSPCGCR